MPLPALRKRRSRAVGSTDVVPERVLGPASASSASTVPNLEPRSNATFTSKSQFLDTPDVSEPFSCSRRSMVSEASTPKTRQLMTSTGCGRGDSIRGKQHISVSQAELNEVLEVAEEGGYGFRSAYEIISSSGREPARGIDKGVMVLADLAGLDAARGICEKLRQENDDTLPIIAVIVGGAPLCAAAEAVVDAQRALCDAGASDVLVTFGGKAELKLALSMCMEREKAKRLELQALFRQTDELQQHIDELERQPRDLRNDLFWKSVDTIFPGFPIVKPDIESNPGIGTEIGPCVLDEWVGNGTYGAVYAAVNRDTNIDEAIKVIPKDRLLEMHDVSSIWKEIKVLSRLNHPGVVAFHGAIHGPCHMFIRMEFVGSLNLSRAMAKAGGVFSFEVSQGFMAQLASATAYFHKCGVVHRDVKPENIALTDCLMKVKILDFGSATSLTKVCLDMAGTMPFMAPEILEAEGQEPYDPAGVDVWALGVVLLEMLWGYGTLNKMMAWESIPEPDKICSDELTAFFGQPGTLEETLRRDRWEDEVSEDLLLLLEGMLRPNLRDRMIAAEVVHSAWLRSLHR